VNVNLQSTTGELIESWLEPNYPDLDKIKEEISLLQKEVEELKAKQSKLPFGKTPVASTSSNTDVTVSSHQLARKGSLASSSTAVVHKEMDGLTGGGVGGVGVESLLAPLPRMMPIAEMQDKAMQAHNARRKEIEEALQAARAAKEEEERLEREKMEAIEAAKKAEEDAIREKERKEREEKEMEERERREEEEEVARLKRVEADSQLKVTESKGEPNEDEMTSSNAIQMGASSSMNTAPSPRKGSNASNPYGEQGGGGGAGGAGEGYFDDSYNLLMDNNFGMYGGDEDGENGYSNGDDAVMLDNSLFAEYMDQMGSM
jgi:DNA repair exonuclease SbcCD ATPase subunit